MEYSSPVYKKYYEEYELKNMKLRGFDLASEASIITWMEEQDKKYPKMKKGR